MEHATECLNDSIEEAAQTLPSLALYGGLCGLGWTVEHVSRILNKFSESVDSGVPCHLQESSDVDEDLTIDIDVAVLSDLDRKQNNRHYDLVSGLVGFGVYFLERWPRESARLGLLAVFESLETLALDTESGITWHSGPELLPEWQRRRAPDGYYNLGVAHGVPGIIHFLSELSAIPIVDQERVSRLLVGAVEWLIAQQLPRNPHSRFSSWIVPGEKQSSGRMGWCYGDLGILAVLLQVARRANRGKWLSFAHGLLDHCLAWSPQANGEVNDAPLCHGAAGIAHVFNRIYQAERDKRCLDAALAWFAQALGMRQPGAGMAGFLTMRKPDPDRPAVWEPSPAFLDGAGGVALALLATITPIEPAWDRLLLLSGRNGSDPSCAHAG